MLKRVLPYSNIFGKVLVMGNLSQPIVTDRDLVDYWHQIRALEPAFNPLMTVMLTKKTSNQVIQAASQAGAAALKMIPGGTSTGSSQGVALSDLRDYYHILQEAARCKLVFSGHWELMAEPDTGDEIPEAQREIRAIPYLIDVIRNCPKLKIVVEHVSTAAMIKVVEDAPDNVAATITGHHLGPYHLGEVIKDGTVVNPLLYCKPVLKTINDIKAVRRAATSGNPKFFFGSDSAPHSLEKKMALPPAAGIFSAPTVISHVFSVFYEEGCEQRFENFTAKFGTEFYNFPANRDKIVIEKRPWIVPKDYDGVVPFLAGQELSWQVARL
ncbi:MAG: hypothetical protein WC453_01430 [Patescibacteria group bacterium]